MTIKISPAIYSSMSYDKLLVLALFELEEGNNPPTTFENLVAKCFYLFPKRFQLPGFPEWPDSSIVEKSWLRCRSDMGLIYGNKSKGFLLTSKGLAVAKDVVKKLGIQGAFGNLSYGGHKGDARTRSGRLVKHIENSVAFKKYRAKEAIDTTTDFEFCDLLYSTLDTVPELRKRNLEELKYHASIYERYDILTFLEKCQKHFSKLLEDPKSENYTGGMIRKKKKK
ncbi:MAG: hypothetical protein UT61_C0047G0006 [Candidatus Woesebacteria bacterium GW2011_GWA1_39_8]|uniref:Uncharacterized protein n=1 Tax=Candidatus Woesebacteria bacterium GW2011_GWA1_39_8 TaxID=1618552 RepID=A0A0G0SSG2_9BACT|nr:MAG: hypothetical protein UT61_C0047G0006 [Candidatus Woesebacteria bacterium GW2011_GWA1_39_8]